MGLLSKKENYNQMVGRYQRSNQAGDHLHTNYLQIESEPSSPDLSNASSEVEADEINPFGFLGKK